MIAYVIFKFIVDEGKNTAYLMSLNWYPTGYSVTSHAPEDSLLIRTGDYFLHLCHESHE